VLAEAQTRLAAAGKALQQQLLQRGALGQPDSAAACQAARTAAAARGTQASGSSIAFASEDTWVQAVGSSGRLNLRMAAAGGVVRDYTAMTAAQCTLGSGDQLNPLAVAVDAVGHIVVAGGQKVHVLRAGDGSCIRTLVHPRAQLGTSWGVAVIKPRATSW
jgi:hypothetical protein